MTWPFENDTGAIVKKLAKRSLSSGGILHGSDTLAGAGNHGRGQSAE